MSDDATFEDSHDKPVNIGALDADDLQVISALCQDAVFPITEMRWQAKAQRFALLLNRFRWEDPGQDRHGPERVQSLLVFDNVLGVASQGIDRSQSDMVLSLLSIAWNTGDDGAGEIRLTLAGDGAIRLKAEAIEAGLRDVTRPYRAPSRSAPDHPA
ncbi:DUF2948 family protein [Alisedimentitalea sp. MJ-SS2]|uniref:DUF2948 family protein n=1 Tax=Aliisedimentitalea sp. MJ-SS2 TaxID=3049795 RepID=UPI0029102D9E|nr:DUF2948 family protein [Alisedimentitalea sp. MJ-SS2]MDU8927154.1 DUF2948 family protein [Alisedimentitalea sp. MJ-SS2]